ncbi:DNA replication/repair protein RecF [Hyphomicrobium sp. 2TAF46]|uniref:DNA replication/repair protein RecF n=1 Tax=Hyphomicrobium sp. 2TAF46 TaxID=3233019 RepID=UPI003F8FA1BB
MPNSLWVERLTLTNFRSYVSASVATDAGPQVIVGANGSGKTNLLEALSLLSPGTGLRRVPFVDLARAGGDGSFAIAAHAHTLAGPADIGTGLQARTPTPNPSPQGGGEFSRSSERSERAGRIVRIDGSAQSGSGILGDYLEIVWVTPAMDGLFTGPASERRRFLDRLILCFDHSYRTIAGRFERAMTSRNRLLADGVRDNAQLSGFEQVMAETGVAVAAARLEAVAAMAAIVQKRRERDPDSAFPWSSFQLVGTIEDDLARFSAIEAEDAYARTLRETRERDRAASRTLDGPHRSDLIVEHGPKALEARQCSTGEQKALLLGLVLAHAELLTERQEGAAPILLLDEITAHLDVHRRGALFAEILRLGAQAWMTGTDADAFSALRGKAQFWGVEEGKIRSLS